MNLSLRLWTLGLLLLAMILASAPACAQFSSSIPSGSYVFSEAGPAFTSLGQLAFAANRTVTGVEIQWRSCTLKTYAVQGTVSSTGERIHLTLNATGLDATDENGDPLVFVKTVELLTVPAGEFVSIRTDSGMYATGTMIPSAPPAKGMYILNGKPIDPAALSVGVVTLDGAGGVSGRALLVSYGVTYVMAMNGSYGSQPNGFQTLTMTGQTTDSDGNTVSSAETYAMLGTRKDVRMMRIDRDSMGVLVLLQRTQP